VLTAVAKTHARKVAKELGVKAGIIYLPGQEEKFYEDSDMGPEFRQRRQYVVLIPENVGYLS
jgi:Xaa-Pro dipeptidase